jgi:hypothetical protein
LLDLLDPKYGYSEPVEGRANGGEIILLGLLQLWADFARSLQCSSLLPRCVAAMSVAWGAEKSSLSIVPCGVRRS